MLRAIIRRDYRRLVFDVLYSRFIVCRIRVSGSIFLVQLY